jgi:predicted DCC family thiol-disulfide oxidoreductase YuxK/protein-S-isoprenylcysteine O-methyltransferase Ste14
MAIQGERDTKAAWPAAPAGLLVWTAALCAAALPAPDGWHFGGAMTEAAGVALLALGGLLGLAAAVVRLRWTAATSFVVAGPYRHLRNPLVAAALFCVLGSALLRGSAVGLAALFGALLLWEGVLRRRHEEALEAAYGPAFSVYRRRVRCWRPRLHGYDPAREADEPALAAERTTPPGIAVVLYDGHCRFCTPASRRLLRLARPGAVQAVDFQEPGALDRFPGVSFAACMECMHLVTATGRVHAGFEAAVQAVATRRPWGWIAWLYYLPGLRLLCDLAYRLVAAYRYRLLGKTVAAGGCDGGSCSLHLRPR